VILGQTGPATALPPNTPTGGYVPSLYVDNTGALRESLFWHGSITTQNVTSGHYNDGHPHQVVATYANGTDTLYVDGQLISSLTASENGYSASYNYVVGTGYSGNGGSIWPHSPGDWYPFSGTLDEVSVYGTALSAARVQAHYTAGSGYRSAVLADSPTAYYRLDDGSPNTGATTGYGLWPISQTDANGQTTTIAYDALGRESSRTLPGETAGLSTLATAYTVWCSGTGAQAPCVEVDRTQRLNSTTTATSRAFYDGLGHLVETRSPAPGGQDVVRYSYYDLSQRLAFQSVPYFVSAYTGGPGSAAYSVPDTTQAGTSYAYDGLGRVTSSTDALSFQSRKSYSVVCSPAGTGDAGCYEQTLSIDPNGHQGSTLVDGLGRTAYEQRYTGNSSANYALYATAKYTYDFAGELTRIVQPDGSTQTTFGYDMAGRRTAMTDPDLGAQSYSYDQDGTNLQGIPWPSSA
jgi:YD repeat-containing protein